MPRQPRYEVRWDKASGEWIVRQAKELIASYSTKTAAIKAAVQHARSVKGQLFIYGKNGRVQDERTYGRDPRITQGLVERPTR